MREGLADAHSMHEMLTNQILLFHFETVATPWLQYIQDFLNTGESEMVSADSSLVCPYFFRSEFR